MNYIPYLYFFFKFNFFSTEKIYEKHKCIYIFSIKIFFSKRNKSDNKKTILSFFFKNKQFIFDFINKKKTFQKNQKKSMSLNMSEDQRWKAQGLPCISAPCLVCFGLAFVVLGWYALVTGDGSNPENATCNPPRLTLLCALTTIKFQSKFHLCIM